MPDYAPQTGWPSLNAGDLRHSITIVEIGPTQDSFGQVQPGTMTTIRSTMGGVNLVSMREAFGSNQLSSQATDVWTVRWTSVTLKPGMLLQFGSRTYRIQAINNVGERNITLHLLCLELNAPSA